MSPQSRSAGISPHCQRTVASSNSPTSGSPVRANATAPAFFAASERAVDIATLEVRLDRIKGHHVAHWVSPVLSCFYAVPLESCGPLWVSVSTHLCSDSALRGAVVIHIWRHRPHRGGGCCGVLGYPPRFPVRLRTSLFPSRSSA